MAKKNHENYISAVGDTNEEGREEEKNQVKIAGEEQARESGACCY